MQYLQYTNIYPKYTHCNKYVRCTCDACVSTFLSLNQDVTFPVISYRRGCGGILFSPAPLRGSMEIPLWIDDFPCQSCHCALIVDFHGFPSWPCLTTRGFVVASGEWCIVFLHVTMSHMQRVSQVWLWPLVRIDVVGDFGSARLNTTSAATVDREGTLKCGTHCQYINLVILEVAILSYREKIPKAQCNLWQETLRSDWERG